MPNFLRIVNNLSLLKKETVSEEKVTDEKKNPSSKTFYAFVDRKLVGQYDSITLFATALGMSRPMVKRAIENGTVLTNGFKLKLTNK